MKASFIPLIISSDNYNKDKKGWRLVNDNNLEINFDSSYQHLKDKLLSLKPPLAPSGDVAKGRTISREG